MAEYVEREAANADDCGEANKIKTPFAKIIVGGSWEKPCYSILWWDTADKECNIGFSSYCLDFVFKWLEEEFEIVAETEDVAPVVHGRWLHVHVAVVDTTGDCSVCNTEAVWRTHRKPYSLCPNCGARMDGE